MTRFFCFSLLLLVVLPLVAQEEPRLNPMIPHGHQAVLMRMQNQLTQELQQVQRMLSVIPPTETQFLGTLQAQQTELTKQIRDIAQQLQASEPVSTAAPPELSGMLLPQPTQGLLTVPPAPAVPGLGSTPPNGLSGMLPPPISTPGMVSPPLPVPPQPNPYTITPAPYPQADTLSYDPYQMVPMNPSMPWAPNTPSTAKELTEVKQTVELLRKDIAELKDTVKALETQIQLLNRNILLSEKAREQ
jgi:cell division protein FtsB